MHRCVGIDVSKHHLDWTFGEDGPVEHLPNTPAGIRRLLERARRQEPILIAVESTGGYERELVVALQEAGLPVVLVNPWRVRRFGEGLGRLAKTDPIDARLLALYAERAQPPRRPLPGPRARRMADLVARRRQLLEIVVAEKSRLENAPPGSAKTSRASWQSSSGEWPGSTLKSMLRSRKIPSNTRRARSCKALPPWDQVSRGR